MGPRSMNPLSLVPRLRAPTPKSAEHAPRFIVTPAVIEQIQREVAYAAETGSHLRVAGRGHTRAPLARCDDGLLQLSRFTGIEDVDAVHGIVWVRTGTRLAQLARELASYGMALPTLGWPGNETIGGAVSIGSYGIGTSDNQHPCPVIGLRLVGADGALYSIGAQDERLSLARVGLGTLGVLSHVGLRCVPATHVDSSVSRSTFGTVCKRVDALRAHDYVEWYWMAHSDHVHVRNVDHRPRQAPGRTERWLQRSPPPLQAIAAQLRDRLPALHQLPAVRLLPDRMRAPVSADAARAWTLFRDSGLGDMGFALPIDRLADTLSRLGTLLRAIDRRHNVLVRVRYACADSAALSPAEGGDTAFVHLPLPEDGNHQRVADYADAAADVFDRAGARPLWSMPYEHHIEDLAAMYPRWGEFALLRAQLDPQGLFLNDYLAGIFGTVDEDVIGNG